MNTLAGKKVLVMGLGLHGGGVGAVKFLVREGAKVKVTDLKNETELAPSLKELEGFPVEYLLGQHRQEDFRSCDLVLKNPGVSQDSPYLKIAKEAGIPIETDVGIFFERCPGFIIGITGTKGKSTTAALVAHIFKTAKLPTILAGNIRTSVLSILPEVRKETIVVLELSSFQLEDAAYKKISPDLALLTNFFPDHLDRYPNLSSYAKAKSYIFAFQKPEDLAIFNGHDPLSSSYFKQIKARRFFFCPEGFKNNCQTWKSQNAFWTKRFFFPVQELKIFGKHNYENALAALTVASLVHLHPSWVFPPLTAEQITRALATFSGLEGRMQDLGTIQEIRVINDTAATNPEATAAALDSFTAGRIILIAGGMDKGLDYRALAKIIKDRAKALILLEGDASEKILAALPSNSFPIKKGFQDIKAAVLAAFDLARPQDTILFSPGAASFNLFQHEFDRGEQFVKAISSWLQGHPGPNLQSGPE